MLRFIFFCIYSSPALAVFLTNVNTKSTPSLFHEEGRYVIANEGYPYDAISFFNYADVGVYVSVGTERGWIGAALSKASHLLLVDYDAMAVRYNQVNVAMIKMAKNRKEYLKFRLTLSGFEDFASRLFKVPTNIDFDLARQSLSSQEEKERIGAFFLGQEDLNLPLRLVSEHHAFYNSNYLYNDEMFEHLKKMVDAGRVQAQQLDLTDQKAVSMLVDEIKKTHLQVAVLDLSNVFEHLKKERYSSMFANLKKWERVRTPNGIVLTTERLDGRLLLNSSRYAIRVGAALVWNYFAFSMSSFAQEPLNENLIAFLTLRKREKKGGQLDMAPFHFSSVRCSKLLI